MKTIQQARDYAAELNFNMAKDCFDTNYGFASHISYSDKVKYRKDNIQQGLDIEAGKLDHNFTIAQRMHYFLTGDCVALLP